MADILDQHLANELAGFAQEIAEESRSNREEMLAALKQELQGVSESLLNKQREKQTHEVAIKLINEEIAELESQIRTKWEPLLGADAAELELNGVTLSAKPTMNISVEDDEAMKDWFLNHGYGSVMKYQIHNQTMKKIAKEELEGGTVIPGLKYTKFTLIKVK